jgi:hypothetical protein
MIVCSCNVISDREIEDGLIEILNQPNAPIPTPGVVYRHLRKRMNCCGCAPIAVETIYKKVEVLESRGAISPYVCATARNRLLEFYARRALAGAKTSRTVSTPACASNCKSRALQVA